MNYKIYFPLSYTFSSRIKTLGERISWLLIYPMFLSWIVYLFNANFSLFIISFFITISSYEIGYLYNDVITTKKEKNPTIRHEKYIEDNFYKIIYSRIFSCLIGLLLIYFFYSDSNIFLIIFLLILTQLVFFIHNTIRSKLNIISYVFLVTLRYITPIFFILNSQLFFIVFLVFPLCRTLEHSCKKKYKILFLQKVIKNPDIFRVIYLSLLFLFIYFVYENNVYLFISGYFLFIRIIALLVSKIKIFRRNKHHSY